MSCIDLKEFIFLIVGFFLGLIGSIWAHHYNSKKKKRNIAKFLKEMVFVEAKLIPDVIDGIVKNIKGKKSHNDDSQKILFFPTSYDYINEDIALLENDIIYRFISYNQGVIAANRHRAFYIEKLSSDNISHKRTAYFFYLIGLDTYVKRSNSLLEAIQKEYSDLFKNNEKKILYKEPNFKELWRIVNEGLPKDKKNNCVWSL